MHLTNETTTNVSIWSAFAWEKRDVRSDMMKSLLWPFAMGLIDTAMSMKGYQIHFEIEITPPNSSRKTIFSLLSGRKKSGNTSVGKCILFFYYLVECFLEIAVIVLVTHGFLEKVNDLEYSRVILLAHYFYLLAILNRHIFMFIAVMIERHTKDTFIDNRGHNNGLEERRVYPTILILIHNIGIWLCIRYNYQIHVLLLIQNIIFVFEPITYFYNFIKPGTCTAKVKIRWLLCLAISSFQELI